jgi:hypothetical protein
MKYPEGDGGVLYMYTPVFVNMFVNLVKIMKYSTGLILFFFTFVK